MAKTLKDAQLSTRSARARLEPGLHWRGLDQDVHLGYRKGVRTGRWLVRWRLNAGYKQTPLGGADDALEADGSGTLTYDQALRAARDHVEETRQPAPSVPAGPVPTIKMVTDAHADAIEHRQASSGRIVSRDCRSRFKSHVSADAISSITLPSLTSDDLAAWRKGLHSKTLKPASVKRIVADLKAALNEAATVHRAVLDTSFRMMIAEGLAPKKGDPVDCDIRPNMILSVDEWHRLLSAAKIVDVEEEWDGQLYLMVVALAATGARFSQLMRCRVSDLVRLRQVIHVPVSWKGKKEVSQKKVTCYLTEDVVAELEKAAAGRNGAEPLLRCWGYRRGKGIRWEKEALRAWRTSEMTDPFSTIVARAGLPSTVTAYALRHTSIVRVLGLGVPVRMVAVMHDTSSEMIERYYSAHIQDAFSEVAQRAAIGIKRDESSSSTWPTL
jgi:integrase